MKHSLVLLVNMLMYKMSFLAFQKKQFQHLMIQAIQIIIHFRELIQVCWMCAFSYESHKGDVVVITSVVIWLKQLWSCYWFHCMYALKSLYDQYVCRIFFLHGPKNLRGKQEERWTKIINGPPWQPKGGGCEAWKALVYWARPFLALAEEGHSKQFWSV